jgi:hypothetical protein
MAQETIGADWHHCADCVILFRGNNPTQSLIEAGAANIDWVVRGVPTITWI